uniref:MatE protein n=1 Tax=Candidatus Kentrum sp. DK TaxID=2126562 RepID=A0A450SD50_9GAMM|nr:MAG: MatE protein [Candidatus Kentron sp. DK]
MFFFSIFGFLRLFREITHWHVWRPNRGILGRFFRLGWPKGLEFLLTNAIFSVFALLAGWIGVRAVAANTITLQTALLVSYTLPLAVADVVTVRVGAALARESHREKWRALNGGMMALAIVLLPPVVLFGVFPEWVVALFVDPEMPESQALLSLASPLILLLAVFVIVDGLRLVGGQALNGLSDMRAPTLIAALAYWGIALPLGAWLGFAMDLGVLGFWIGLTLGIAVAAGCYLARFRRLARAIKIAV